MLMENNDAGVAIPIVKNHTCYNKMPVKNVLVGTNSVLLGFKKL